MYVNLDVGISTFLTNHTAPITCIFDGAQSFALIRGGPKILSHCALPLTSVGVVGLIVTELCVLGRDKPSQNGMAPVTWPRV